MRGGTAGDEGEVEFRAAFASLSRRWFWWFVLGAPSVRRDGWDVEPFGLVMAVVVLLALRRLRAATSGVVARLLGWALGLGVVAVAADLVTATPAAPEWAELAGLVPIALGVGLFAVAMARWLGDRGAEPGLVRAWRTSAGLWFVESALAVAGVVTFGAWAVGGDPERTVGQTVGPLEGGALITVVLALVTPLFHTAWSAVRTGEALGRQTRGAGVRPAEA